MLLQEKETNGEYSIMYRERNVCLVNLTFRHLLILIKAGLSLQSLSTVSFGKILPKYSE